MSVKGSKGQARRRNWALGAGIFGIVWSTAILPAEVSADVIRAMVDCRGSCLTPAHGYLEPRLVIPVSVALVLGPPIIAAGAASARRVLGTAGCKACRVLGSIAFGLSVPLAGVWSGFSIYHESHMPSGFDPPHGPMAAAGALAALSGVLMSVDAFVSWKPRAPAGNEEAMDGQATAPTVLYPVLGFYGGSAIVGIGGTF